MFAAGISITEKLNGSAIGLYAMLFICLLLAYTLFVVITSLTGNLADLGNETVMAKFMPDGFKGFQASINHLTAHRFRTGTGHRRRSVYRSGRRGYNNRPYNKYRYSSSVYEMYGRSGYDGYRGYGSYRTGYDGGYRGSSYRNSSVPDTSEGEKQTAAADSFDYSQVYNTLDFEDQVQEEYSDLSDNNGGTG